MNALTSIETWYDTVIGSQADFEEWYTQLDAGTYKGDSVLILSGTYRREDGKGLHLPSNLRQLHGLGQVEIYIDNLVCDNNNKGAIYYSSKPYSNQVQSFSIKNIVVTFDNAEGNPPCGFYNCINLMGCKASIAGGYSTVGYYSCDNLIGCFSECYETLQNNTGFDSCTNLINCRSNCSLDTGGQGSSGFSSCKKLINCYGDCGGEDACAFNGCTDLDNCYGIGDGGYDGGYGFSNCKNLSNCTGVGISNEAAGYSFFNCKVCSNCIQDPDTPSSTATWGGTNINISKDTCPEYTG